MRITINGNLGSGKSTIGRRLADALKVRFFSTGQMFREIGRIKNLNALKTNLAAENNTEIDFQVDEWIKHRARTEEDFVIDSRMAWHFVKDAINVFLSASPETAATRIMQDATRLTERFSSFEEALASLASRRNSELGRYRRLYNVNIEAEGNYDLLIITDNAVVDDVVALILKFVEARYPQKFWIPKSRTVPMVGVGEASAARAPAAVRFSDRGSLPLLVNNNFGFYFGDANRFVDYMFHESSLIPYTIEAPGLASPVDDALRLAEATLEVSDLEDWHKATRVDFEFANRLRKNRSVNQRPTASTER